MLFDNIFRKRRKRSIVGLEGSNLHSADEKSNDGHAEFCRNVGHLFDHNGQHDVTLLQCRKSEERLQKILRISGLKDSLICASAHCQLGEALMTMEKNDEAESEILTSLEIFRAVAGDDHSHLVNTYLALGALKLKKQDYKAARRSLAKAHALQQKQVGMDDPVTIATTNAAIRLVDKKLADTHVRELKAKAVGWSRLKHFVVKKSIRPRMVQAQVSYQHHPRGHGHPLMHCIGHPLTQP